MKAWAIVGCAVVGTIVMAVVYKNRTAPVPICRNCNIVMISADEFRADDLPCYGYDRNTAPNICAFARANTYFTNYYSASSYTYDDYVTQMTGLYPSTHHVIFPVADMLDPAAPALPKLLQSRGYKTVYVGITSNLNVPLYVGANNGFDEVHTNWFSRTLSPWFEKLLPDLTSGKPTFLYFYSYMLHDPYLPGSGPRRYVEGNFSLPVTQSQYEVSSLPFYSFVLSDFESRMKAGYTIENINRNAAIVKSLGDAIEAGDLSRAHTIFLTQCTADEQGWYYALWYRHNTDPKNPAMVSYLHGLYDEQINALDRDLTPLFDFLKRPDVRRRTIVIITSDHADEFAEHGFLYHENNVYNTSTHVPFIIAVPGIHQGAVNTLSGSADLFPTLLNLLGMTPPAQTDGVSLVPSLLGEKQLDTRYVLSEHRATAIQSITDGDWKFYIDRTVASSPVYELYNLVSDPGEQHNLASAYPAVRKRLNTALRQIVDGAPKYTPVVNGFPGWIDGTLRQRLIQTGYF